MVDLANDRNSFRQRVLALSVTNNVNYRGYDLVANLSLMFSRKDFDDPFLKFLDTDVTSIVLRVMLGY